MFSHLQLSSIVSSSQVWNWINIPIYNSSFTHSNVLGDQFWEDTIIMCTLLLAQITVPVEKKQKADNAQISSVKHINKNKINDILRTKLFWCTSTTVRFTIHVISPIEVALLKITMSQTLNIQYSMFVLPKIQQAKIILNSCRLCKCSKAKKSCYNAFGDWVVVCEIAWLWTCLLDPEAWVV